MLRRIRASIAEVPTRFTWFEEGKIAASGFPASERQLRWLYTIGIRGIITLTEYPISTKLREKFDFNYMHIPIDDHKTPSVEQLHKAVSMIEGEIRNKRPVLVHCLAGLGRTGTVLASYLVSKGLSARDAIEIVRKLRPGSIEKDQEESVFLFEEYITKKKKQ